jgi:uncharacterized protein
VKWLIYNLYFPLVLLAGKAFRLPADRAELHLIALNNRMQNRSRRQWEKILILTPSCLQNKDCQNNVVEDIAHCQGCGKCRIKDLLQLSAKYRTRVAVATGGRLARQIVQETKADAVIAVACEKELVSGILDTYPVGVMAIVNSRPFGPCVNTDVDIAQVEKILAGLLGQE